MSSGHIWVFVTYCVYGESGSSLLIESTNPMIRIEDSRTGNTQYIGPRGSDRLCEAISNVKK